jgi:hypothetical protein
MLHHSTDTEARAYLSGRLKKSLDTYVVKSDALKIEYAKITIKLGTNYGQVVDLYRRLEKIDYRAENTDYLLGFKNLIKVLDYNHPFIPYEIEINTDLDSIRQKDYPEESNIKEKLEFLIKTIATWKQETAHKEKQLEDARLKEKRRKEEWQAREQHEKEQLQIEQLKEERLKLERLKQEWVEEGRQQGLREINNAEIMKQLGTFPVPPNPSVETNTNFSKEIPPQ